jgi:protein involved in polysaccharide export with SLBB domain
MLASFVCALTLQGPPAAFLRLKIGDGIRVTIAQRVASVGSPFDGSYVVSDDGAIYGSGFGRLAVAGKPFSDAEKAIRLGLKPYVRPEFVFVRLESQRGEAIFLVGGSRPGRMALEPGLTLRKVLPQTDAADWDLQEVELVRDGKRIVRSTLGSLFRTSEPILDAPLSAGDVVSVVPTESLRIWIAGDIARPGEMKLSRGATVSQVLAAAGGPTGGRLDRDRRVRLRRGLDERTLAYDGGRIVDDVAIEAGDLVTVTTTPQVKVTVTGEATQQGEFVLEENASLVTALAKAGGASPGGSLKSVIVLRNGEAIRVDASDPVSAESSVGGHLQNGDLVIVPKNDRRFYVVGEVSHSAAFTMDESRTYRLADAITQAGGLGANGVFRRITIVRPGPDGRPKPTQYNLDEFLKDGKLEANPILQPGDAIYVGTSKGLTLGSVTKAVSSLILLEALGGR